MAKVLEKDVHCTELQILKCPEYFEFAVLDYLSYFEIFRGHSRMDTPFVLRSNSQAGFVC